MSYNIDYYRAEIDESSRVKMLMASDHELLNTLERIAERCIFAIKNGFKVIFAGNGGSFADAQHISAEFVSRFKFDRYPMAAVALGTNSSVISAIGNDYGYESIFARELQAIGRQGDIFIPITTSGNSPNILHAVTAAKELGIEIYCLTGSSDGLVTSLCECIKVPSIKTERIQECHILLGHILCGHIENSVFGHSKN